LPPAHVPAAKYKFAKYLDGFKGHFVSKSGHRIPV
jgi:hypothetical protein